MTTWDQKNEGFIYTINIKLEEEKFRKKCEYIYSKPFEDISLEEIREAELLENSICKCYDIILKDGIFTKL